MKSTLCFLRAALLAPLRFVRTCWTECPKHQKCTMLILSAAINIALGLILLGGCASTPKGIATEQKYYTTGTNVVSKLQQVLPLVPAPFSTPLGVILAGVSAALATWNVHQQRTLSQLKKDSAANTLAIGFQQAAVRGSPSPSPQAPPAQPTGPVPPSAPCAG